MKKIVKEERILDVFGQIDEKYIEEAAPETKQKKSRWIKWGAVAALFVIIAISGIVIALPNLRETVVIGTGDYMVWNTAEELVNATDLVFSGTVEDIRYEMLDIGISGGEPYTIYKIKVKDVYKGSIDGDTVEIKQAGGKFLFKEYVWAEAADISEGTNYLFLTKTFQDSYPSLLNPSQGLFDLDESGNNDSLNESFGITLESVLEVLNK